MAWGIGIAFLIALIGVAIAVRRLPEAPRVAAPPLPAINGNGPIADPPPPAASDGGVGRWIAVGCATAAAVGGALLLVALLGLAVIVRACSGNDWHFTVRVEVIDQAEICLTLVGDGPGYVENGCIPVDEVVWLPDDITSGDCLQLTQHLHGDLVFEKRVTC